MNHRLNQQEPADTPQPPVSVYVPEKPRYGHTAAMNLLFLVIFQAVSLILHGMVLGNSDRYRMPSHAAERVPTAMFLYSVAALFVLGDILVGIYFGDRKRRRAYLDATSVEKRGATAAAEGEARYRRLALTEGLVSTLAGAALWLIPTLLYAVSLALSGRGYGYSEAMGIEKFFVGFIGLCEAFDNPWIGWLIGVTVLFGFNYFGRLLVHHRWNTQRIRR